MLVNASQSLGASWPGPGHEIALNEDLNVIGLGDCNWTGEVVTLLDLYPNLLDKYVGETERRISIVFKRASEMARRGLSVAVFFPRIDLLPPVLHASRANRDVYLGAPLVAAEISSLHHGGGRVAVIVTSRRRAIDGILTGPGRLEVQVEVARPGREDAREILSWCLAGKVGFEHGAIERVLDLMYDESSFAGQVEVTSERGKRHLISFPGLISRALLHDIANRVKARALMRASVAEASVQAQDHMPAARSAMEQAMQLAGASRRYDWGWLHESTGFAATSAACGSGVAAKLYAWNHLEFPWINR
jgi:proteasome-associated ATPase